MIIPVGSESDIIHGREFADNVDLWVRKCLKQSLSAIIAVNQWSVIMGVFDGLDEIVDRYFGVTEVGSSSPHYENETSAKNLSKNPPAQFDVNLLLKEMLTCVEQNVSSSARRPSEENWRWEKKLNIASQNDSKEKILEKHLVKAGDDSWVNQVPTASGLINQNSDKKRCVDLVHRRQPNEYELIELKVRSNTPLKAAIEVLEYGLLYIFSRKYYAQEALQSKALLQAENVHLRVLAPADYYRGYHFDWLSNSLNSGLSDLLKDQDFKMTFQFTVFPKEFEMFQDVQNANDVLNTQNVPGIFSKIEPVVW